MSAKSRHPLRYVQRLLFNIVYLLTKPGIVLVIAPILGVPFGIVSAHATGATSWITYVSAAATLTVLLGAAALLLHIIVICQGENRLKKLRAKSLWLIACLAVFLTASAIFSSQQAGGVDVREYMMSVLTGIVGAVSAFVAIQVFIFGEKLEHVGTVVSRASDKSEQISGKIDATSLKFDQQLTTLNETSHNVVYGAIGAIEKLLLLDVRLAERLKTLAPNEPFGALAAIRVNLEAWWRQLATDDTLLSALWTRYLETYLREEAVEVRKGELVTSAPIGLLVYIDTLREMLAVAEQQNATLVARFVTAVHPKDWYNWPHGDRKYFESDFVGQYYRSFAELATCARTKLGTRFDCARVFLCSERDHERTEEWARANEPRWPLESFEDFRDLKDFWVLNIALPLDKWPEDTDCEFAKKLRALYQDSSSRDGLVVPVWYDKWVDREAARKDRNGGLNRKRYDLLKAVQSARASCQQACNCAQTLIAAARDYSIATCNELKTALDAAITGASVPELSEPWKRLSTAISTDSESDFFRLMSDMHVIQERLGVSNPDAAKNITALVRHILRLRALRRGEADQANPLKWQSMAQVFGRDLQHPDNNMRFYKVSDVAREILSPEFAGFGFTKGNATGERDGVASKDVAWKVVLVPELRYPFETTRVRICTDGDNFSRHTKMLEDLDIAVKISLS